MPVPTVLSPKFQVANPALGLVVLVNIATPGLVLETCVVKVGTILQGVGATAVNVKQNVSLHTLVVPGTPEVKYKQAV